MAEVVGIRGIRLEDPGEVEDGLASAISGRGDEVLDLAKTNLWR
jgi:thiamine pyrophosphate-dependent acetolactate synthase large subunit-like protein